jgi:hypothetical protein
MDIIRLKIHASPKSIASADVKNFDRARQCPQQSRKKRKTLLAAFCRKGIGVFVIGYFP